MEFEVVRDAELGPIREEELTVVECSRDGGMDADDRVLEDPEPVAEAPEAEGAEKQDGADPDRGGERGGSPTGFRLRGRARVAAQRCSASFSAFTRMKRLESNEAPSSRTSVKTCARTAAVSATSRRQAKPGRARASFEKSTR